MEERIVHAGPKISYDYLLDMFRNKHKVYSISKGREGRVVFQESRNTSRQLLVELESKRRVSMVFDRGQPVRMVERDGKYIIEDI